MIRSPVSQKNLATFFSALRQILYGAVRIIAWDSLKSGFIDIRHLPRVPRVIALMGLTLVFGFIASILFNDPLRTSGVLEPLPLSSNAVHAVFVPSTAVPLTLLALVLAWSLILTSALHLGRRFRWGVFMCFALFGVPPTFLGSLAGSAVDNPIQLVIILGLAALCWLALVLAFIVLPRLKLALTWEFAFVFGSIGGLFVLMLFAAVESSQLGNVDFVNGYLTAEAITNPQMLILPLICLSGAEIIEFGITFTGWGAQATARYARPWIVMVLLGGFLLYRWGSVLVLQILPGISASEMLALAGAALAAVCLIPITIWRMRHAFGDSITMKWKLALVLVILAPPLLVFVAVIVIGVLAIAQLIVTMLLTGAVDRSALDSLNAVSNFIYMLQGTWRDALYLILTAAGISIAAYAVRRARYSLAAFGMILGWTQFVYWFTENGRPLQNLRYRYADVELWILVALTALTVYWFVRREMTTDRALKLLALALFTWLLYFIDFLDNPLAFFFGIAGISFTAFGILWAVLTAGGRWKVNRDSPDFPQPSRVLMSIGYVLLTLNLSHWFLVTHNVAQRALNDDITFIGLRVLGYTAAYLVLVEGGQALLKKTDQAENA